MTKFVKESLYEENEMASQIPVTDPEVAQRLANGQAALNREDLKLQQLKDKMIPINKKKAQIQKAMIKAQEENARKMNQQAKEQAKQNSQIKTAQEAQANQSAQPTQPIVTPVLPTTESILQSDFDRIGILEDKIVVLMQSAKPDYDKINELIEVVQSFWTCPACRKEINVNDERANGICSSCENKGFWVDPAGGVHLSDDDDYDPASMYEEDTNESQITKDKFYNLSEAYTEFEDSEKKTEDIVDNEYLFFVKVYDGDDWFIAKIFKINPVEDWYGIVKAGDSDNFNKISYDPEYDENAIVEFLKDTYDDVEIIDKEEYNDYVEEEDPSELEEEGGVTGMHL